MFSKYILIVTFLLICNGNNLLQTQFVEFSTDYKQNHDDKLVNYSYRYYIDQPSSKLALDHWEHRNGDQVTGRYGILEPDGYIRTVYYVVNGNSGFRTIVKIRTPNSHQNQYIHNGKQSQPFIPYLHLNPIGYVN